MGVTTGIAWCDATWNPWIGCSKVSEGCDHCYMFREQSQRGHDPTVVHQTKPPRLDLPLRKKRDGSWKIPAGSFVFVCCYSDFFHEDVPDAWRDEALAAMCARPRVTFLLLTKRPARMAAYFDALLERACGYWNGLAGLFSASGLAPMDDAAWTRLWAVDEELFGPRDPSKLGDNSLGPVRNIWRGVTAENQERADERVSALLAIERSTAFWTCPTFVSIEPQLGRVDLERVWWPDVERRIDVLRGGTWTGHPVLGFVQHSDMPTLDWVICGGESGPQHRPFDLDWARLLRDQCQAADVPFFLKQFSANRPESMPLLDGKRWAERPTTKAPRAATTGERA